MEKLIELVNQYEIEKEKSEWVNVDAYVEFKREWVWEWYLNKWLTRFDETDHWEWDNLYWDTAVAYLISKSFWFIKWLVENDKIEWETIWNYQSRTKLRTLTHTAWLWHDAEWKSELEYIKETFTDGLLMLLSISDTPIEDLISYLK